MLNLDKTLVINKDVMQSPNLCDRFSDKDLTSIGQLVFEGYSRDENSRSAWLRRTQSAMDLALQVQKDKNFPWSGCSNVVFPLVTIAALQFSARSYGNIIHGTDVVRYRVIGEDPTGKLKARANRISSHMSWQVLEEDQAWEEQHDRLLINLAIVGTSFLKTYFSSSVGHNVSELVMARDLVLDYYAKSVDAAARKTHIVPLYRNEIHERIMSDTYRDIRKDDWYSGPPAPIDTSKEGDNRKGTTPPQADEDTPFTTLEQHRLLDLDGDGYAEPYVVTIEKTSQCVVRIVARYDKEEDVERTLSKKIIRVKPTEYFTKYSFIPSPDGGIYDVGFGVLLGPLNESVNSGINQLLDSGTMQNSMGGFLGRGAKIRGGTYTMAPWEWKRVDSTGDDLRKSLVPYPERQPSTVMFQLLGLIINYTDRISGTTDQMVGENPGQNTPAETSRNTIEQGMQVYSMIFKRVWRSMKEEFKKLHQLNAVYLSSKKTYGATGQSALNEDYRSNPDLVVPVADPNITSQAQKVQRAVAIRQAAMQVQGYDVPEVERNFLKAMQVEGVDILYPGPDKVPPLPNPKMMVENAKLEGKKADLQMKWQIHITTLQSAARKTLAEIAKLEAEAMKAASEAKSTDVASRIAGFDMALTALKTHHEMMMGQIEAAQKGAKENDDTGGGVQSVAKPPSDARVPQSSGGMEGGSEGAMGGGGVSQ